MDGEELLRKRLEEWAAKSYQNNIYTYTGFFGMGELDIFHRMKNTLAYAGYTLFGGRADCERLMVRFGNEEVLGYGEEFPIVCVELAPVTPKFAETLTHRDYLGSLMNLGIERTTLGDIIVVEKRGLVFCTTVIAPFIMDNLIQIKHTRVTGRMVEAPKESVPPEMEIVRIQAASERIDGVIAKILRLSRNESLELFSRKRVFLNGMLWENTSTLLKPEDVVTVRGFGRFTYQGFEGISKKGRKNILIGMAINKK